VAVLGLIKYVGASGSRIGFELTSCYVNSNHLAAYLEMIIPLILVVLVLDMHIGQKILVGYCLFMMIIAFILSLSRGGWFSLLCALLAMGFIYLKKNGFSAFGKRSEVKNRSEVKGKRVILIALLAGVVFIVTVALGFNNVNYQASSFFDQKRKKQIESFNGRVAIWSATLDLIRDYPVLGVGPGTFPYVYEKYLKRHIGDEYAHSEYLWVMSEWGIASILLVLWMQIILFKETLGLYLKRRSNTKRSLALGIFGSFVAISIHSIVDYNLHFMANMFLVVILAGIVMGMRKNVRLSQDSVPNFAGLPTQRQKEKYGTNNN